MTEDVLKIAAGWLAEGHDVALATVVATWGSSPRPAGSHLAVRHDGHFVGSVSGGCVEGEVIRAGIEVMATRERRSLEFGVSNDVAWRAGLACGGTIRVDVERATTASVATLMARRPPPWRLVIIGAVHLATPLASLAASMDYAVTVVDPRELFASAERFPGVALVTEWPQDALPSLALDASCAVVALTHDPKIDDPALIAALASPAFYVGALGSRKTQAARLVRLGEAGLDATQLARLHGPVGLAIGAVTPAEIAVSIMAELTQRRRQPSIRSHDAAA